ncbi:aldolase catalytic domain-containing protein [bacterium]|nr:aldolase catalytic domain-containing protein [bacterium]MBU1613989.1 aldolase catalytic domain-containing protein [bacterium]
MGNTQFEILDCTIRDGGYLNNWHFDKKLVREVYRALSKCGVDFVEIGYKGTEEHFSPDEYGLWRFSYEDDICEVVSNIKGARLAIMADYGKIKAEDFCRCQDSLIDLVRVAAHKDDLEEAVSLLEKIKEKGFSVALNAMGYSNYSRDEQSALLGLIKDAELDYFYVVDSYGSLFPHQIEPIFEPLLNIAHIKMGFHPHNNLQMAFANTLEAIRCGVHIIDSTIYGMGRAAGNLPTEVIIAYLEKEKKDRYNSIPLLNIIDRYFIDLQNENKWGYQLPYMLSGMFCCHPNYAKGLVDYREYTIEDIYKALDHIRQKNSVGFSRVLLDNLIGEGIIGGILEAETGGKADLKATGDFSEVSYINRHQGKDFLILANGPTLKEYKPKIEKLIEKHDFITLGANNLAGLFKPDYHAFNNKRRFVSYIDTVAKESKLLIGQYISDEMIAEYIERDYEKIYYLDLLNADFGIDEGVITTNCRTISVLLLGIAIVMGAKRIFCVGMDGYKDLEKGSLLFYDEKDEKEDQQMIIERHRWCQRFLGQIDEYLHAKGKEGIHILTPTSYKSFYKGIENYI